MRFCRYIAVVVILSALFSVAVAFAAKKDDAKAAYDRLDYNAALKIWQPLAQAGNADAQYNLGRLYARGEGVPQDDRKAVDWFRRAAKQKNVDAEYNLAGMYA